MVETLVSIDRGVFSIIQPSQPRLKVPRTMDTIQNLLAQRAEIDKIADARREERASAISKIRAPMDEHGLTAADLTAKAPAA